MSAEQLRPGWRNVRFGDVVRQAKHKVDPKTSGIERYVAGEHMDTDDLRIRRWGQVGDGYLGPAFTMRFKAGQVLYGSRRTYLRKVALADFDGICANTTFVVEPATDDILPDFLPYVMTTELFHEHSIKQSKGSVNPYINFSDLKWYEFALPPLDEQQRIVEVLAAATAVRDRQVEVAGAATLLRFAVAEMRAADTPLADLLSSCDYGVSVRATDSGEVPMLRMNNINEHGELDLTDLKYLKRSEVSAADFLREGDILVNRTNSIDHVGKLAIVGPGLDHMVAASYLLRLRVDEAAVLPEYVCACLQSAAGQRQIRGFVSKGVSQANINASNLKKVLLPLPPLEVQKAVASSWSASRELQHRCERRRASTQQLAISLRERLLEGAER